MIWSAGKPPCHALAWAILPLLSCGCVSLLGGKSDSTEPPPPTVAPCQVVAFWEKEVRLIPDPYRGGACNAGLVGRIYLMGPDCGIPITGDGSMVVDLFDVSHGQLVQLEEWNFDKDSLKRLMRKDPRMGGWGYTLFLPWSTYRPDIANVRLRLAYRTPLTPAPIYASESPITLAHPDPSLLASMTSPGMAKGMPTPPPPASPPTPTLPAPTPVPPTAWPPAPPTSTAPSWPPAPSVTTAAAPPWPPAPPASPAAAPTWPAAPQPASTSAAPALPAAPSTPAPAWPPAPPTASTQMTPGVAAAMTELLKTMAAQAAAQAPAVPSAATAPTATAAAPPAAPAAPSSPPTVMPTDAVATPGS